MSAPSRVTQALVASAVVLAGTWFTATPGQAHKAITSKYFYNEHLFPLFRDHCGRCHVDGGVAPMSLMTYDDAAPWAESLRLELLAEDAVPWHPWTLTARELDVMLVWASGGAPRGDVANAPPAVSLVNDWASGAPDIALKAPTFVLAADKNEATAEITLPVTTAGREIAAVDLLPGNAAIVRRATISVKAADGKVLQSAVWRPGQRAAVPLPSAVRLGPGVSVAAAIEYKRTWKYESQEMRDESTVGLYSSKTPSTAAPRPPARQR